MRSTIRRFLAACVLAASSALAAPFVRGDVNQDGTVDIADAVRCLGYLFAGQESVAECLDSADVNDSGLVDIADPIYLLAYLFAKAASPVAPFPACGEDRPGDDLSCEFFVSLGCPPLDPPSGTLVGTSDCKGEAKGDDELLDRECIRYAWEDGVVRLTHVSGSFNCCADIQAEVTVEGTTITIIETEVFESYACPCMCLYDVELEVRNLIPGAYTISFGSETKTDITCTAGLMPGTDGIYCEPRSGYPWRTE